MRTKEKIQFVKRLAFLVRAGIPIETCITTLESQATTRSGKKFFKDLLERVRHGAPLSRALKESHKSFGGPAWSIIRVGEESGTLSEALGQLVVILESSAATRSKIIGALLYPVVIACGTLALTGFLVLYIFPKIIPVFTSLKVPLPFATKLLIGLSVFVRSNFFWICISVVLGVLVLFLVIKFSERFRLWGSKILIKTPFIGRIVQIYILARISALLATLLQSNMKIDEAVALIEEAVTYPVYKEFFATAKNDVSSGTHLSELCSRSRVLFPPLLTNMIAVGEMSGSLADALKNLSLIYESELEMSTKTLTQMIEPVVMIFMSALVGFIAISIITPLYNITSNLRH